MARRKPYEMPDDQKELEQRKHKKINIRHNSPSGKVRSGKVWLKTRRRVRRKLLGG